MIFGGKSRICVAYMQHKRIYYLSIPASTILIGIFVTSEISTSLINSVLNELIKKKSSKDGVKFTSSKLASALDLPRSSIFRLIHPDKEKRMTNPTIGTLIKIVEFFKADGINVSIDDFVGIKKTVNVQDQELGLLRHSITMPVYTLDGSVDKGSSTITINVDDTNNNFVALLTEEDMKPIFKKGSVFIVNKDLLPEDENLVGITFDKKNPILIGKLHKKNNKLTISLFDKKSTEIDLLIKTNYDIIGVVVQIIAKT